MFSHCWLQDVHFARGSHLFILSQCLHIYPHMCLTIMYITFHSRVPAESGEKISLAVTVLLAIAVYMMVVMENVPENSIVVPLLRKFERMASYSIIISMFINILFIITLLPDTVYELENRGSILNSVNHLFIFIWSTNKPLSS